MIVRTLLPDDVLTAPHWELGELRPHPDTTLIALDDDGKLIGLLWMAYGGPAALLGVRFSSEPMAAWPLCAAAMRLAKDLGCKTLAFHVDEGRLLEEFLRRGGSVVAHPAHAVAFSVPQDHDPRASDYRVKVPIYGMEGGHG